MSAEAPAPSLEAFGELEYYLVDEPEQIYLVEEERGYQESAPFSKHRRVREQVLAHLAAMGVPLKYAHGEVANILTGERQLVQHEIELQPVPLAHAADHIILTKWVVREVASWTWPDSSRRDRAVCRPLVSYRGGPTRAGPRPAARDPWRAAGRRRRPGE